MGLVPIQNPEAAKALIGGLGIKGPLGLQIDSVVVPIELVGDPGIVGNPYSSAVPIGGDLNGSALAANFTAITFEATEGGILVVKRIAINNTSGASQNFVCRVMTPADILAVTEVSAAFAINYNSEFVRGAVARQGGVIRELVNTGQLGAILFQTIVLDDALLVIDLPYGYALYGDDPAGTSAIAIWTSAINLPLNVSFMGAVYINKG